MLTRVAALLLAMLVILGGCSAHHGAKAGPLAGYPYRHSDFDYKVAWKTSQVEHGIAVDGVLKNQRYAFVDSLDLTVSLLDRESRVLARETTFPIPQFTRMNEYRPFSLKLAKVAPAEGEMLQFLLRYRVGTDDGLNWMSSFTVDAATGAVIRSEEGKKPDEW